MNWIIQVVVKDKHALQTLEAVEEFAVEKPALSKAIPRLDSSFAAPAMAATKGRIADKNSHNGASAHVNTFIENAKQAGLKQITGSQLAQHMKMGGFTAYAYGYRLNQLLRDKVLKRTRQAGVYEVV